MLGMNAEALHFCVGSFVNFVERIGAMCAGMASMVTPRPQFPLGHPMHGTAGSFAWSDWLGVVLTGLMA